MPKYIKEDPNPVRFFHHYQILPNGMRCIVWPGDECEGIKAKRYNDYNGEER